MSHLPPETSPGTTGTSPGTDRPCPACGEAVPAGSNFCEACGAVLGETVPGAPVSAPATSLDQEAAPIDAATSATSAAVRSGVAGDAGDVDAAGTRPCLQCGGAVGADGWCQTCGAKAPSERDHFRAEPAPWVAAVSDRGIVHHRNEDAMAVQATPDGTAADRRAVLVVLDGVSRTDDSSAASLAGARAALQVLATPPPRGLGTDTGREAVMTHLLSEAAQAADERVVAATTPGTDKPASATFTVTVLDGRTVWHANIGDSRSYWLPDAGRPVQLTVDDSAAQAQIAAGVPRALAESSPQAHAITGWLGVDSPSVVPTVGRLDLDGPGWLVTCSDGLWNYASAPEDLAAQVAAQVAAGHTDPAAVALGLVGFAHRCGGQDNITVALARLDDPGTPPDPSTPPDQSVPPAQTGAADG